MENVVSPLGAERFWQGRRVLITGNTGFKGAWLALMLARRGAIVAGYALPAQDDALFNVAHVQDICPTTLSDIRDASSLNSALQKFEPQTVFHLAAQPLVRRGYADPLGTFSTNVMGTCNLLEVSRWAPRVESIVVVATDKCYRNREWVWGYREDDELGGTDPYSASKAAAEIAVGCFRHSFYETGRIGLASARGGNVIGGGDFAEDRLIPDIVRAHRTGVDIALRHPYATRPWQHVLDCLTGYIHLAEHLTAERASYSRAFNFGPDASSEVSVLQIVDAFAKILPLGYRLDDSLQTPETARLTLDTSLARYRLGWRPKLDFAQTVAWTGLWYSRYLGGEDARALTIDQIVEYEKLERRQ